MGTGRHSAGALGSLALIAAFMLPGPVTAAEPAGGTLSDTSGVVTWEGTLDSGERDVFELRVALPEGVWDEPGGVQIGIHWPYLQDRDLRLPFEPERPGRRDLDLEVLGPDGRPVTVLNGADEDTESVLVDAAGNGTYRVTAVGASADGVAYRGRAEVERPPSVEPVRPLLPDLTVRPQRNVRFYGTDPLFLPRVFIDGCLVEEIAEQGARRCLRFDQSIANAGEGPLELRYDLHDITGEPAMYQRIHRSDGAVSERRAERWETHPTHAHIHYAGFALSRLWRSNRGGARLGREPVRSGRKNGFCLIDVENFRFDAKDDAARAYDGSGCARPETLLGEDNFNGISVGWADIYNWFLPDQYIEVSGLADGFYLLETIADPNGTVVESDETNNSRRTLVRICGGQAEQVTRGAKAC